MRMLNDVLKLVNNMPLNATYLVLVWAVFGTSLAPIDSNAQAVPPRVQGLMINRPIVVPPEPPVQKEIRELKQDVRRTKIELERKIEAERAYRFLVARSSFYHSKLDTLLRNPFGDEGIQDAMKNEKCKVTITPILKYIRKLYLGSLHESGAELRKELQNLLSDPYNHEKIKPLIGQVPDECKEPLYTFLNYMHTLPIQIEQDRVRLK